MDDPRVTDEMVEAALDKWYPGEDWRKVLEEHVDHYRGEMRAAILAALDALPKAAPKPVERKIVQIAAMPNELYCLDNDGKLWFISDRPDCYSDLRPGPPLPAPEGEG